MIHSFDSFCNEMAYVGQKVADVNRKASTKLAIAKRMVAQGIGDDDVRRETGWFTGKFDNKWRYELGERIDMSLADLRPRWNDETKFSTIVDLKQILIDRLFFKAYPKLRNAMVYLEYGAGLDEQGSFTPGSEGDGYYSGRCPEIHAQGDSLEQLTNVLIHEIQHAIQEEEEFRTGGSSRDYLTGYDSETGKSFSRTPEEAHKMYLDIPGEIEARDVANRAKMSPEERKAKRPYTSEDI